jgi:hypothetical protein
LIGAVVPDHARPGTTIQIDGDHFCGEPEHDETTVCATLPSVVFGATPGHVVDATDVFILVEVPELAPGAFDIRVSVKARLSNRVPFMVEP